MRVVIIGSGNVATVLGKKIYLAGHDIIQVVSRSTENANTLASLLNSNASSNILEISNYADIYLVAVSDTAIEHLASKLRLGDKLLVHTAGAVKKEVLKESTTNFGVLYPLQSLRKDIAKIPDIPVVVDANSTKAEEALFEFARDWAAGVFKCNDEQRLKLHLAAVVASNFTNYLYTLAEDFCKTEALQFEMLFPMIKEIAQRLEFASPRILQTGPAVRGDHETIRKHIELLEDHPSLKKIYSSMTESIISYYEGLNQKQP